MSETITASKEKDVYKVYVHIKPTDYVFQRILSRIREPRKRTEFAKEATIHWYYMLKHSALNSRHFYISNEERFYVEGLLPNDYYINRLKPHYSDPNETFSNAIVVRFSLEEDEVFFDEIRKGVISASDFVKEAILEWDCLLNHSHLFFSRYIDKRSETVKTWGEVLKAIDYKDELNVPGFRTQQQSGLNYTNNTSENKVVNNSDNSSGVSLEVSKSPEAQVEANNELKDKDERLNVNPEEKVKAELIKDPKKDGRRMRKGNNSRLQW